MKALRERYAKELEGLEGAEKMSFLAKANVKQGVEVLRRIPTVINAIQERGLEVHGLIYDLGSGKLDEVETGESAEVGKTREWAFERK